MKTTLHYYRFDLSEAKAKEAYKSLCDKLRSQGLEMFDSCSADHSKWYKETIAPIDGQLVTLETEHLFNNQWNSSVEGSDYKNGLRIFDWSEAIYPNMKIKEGMYLDQSPEMIKIRKETFKCGYCGKSYHLPKEKFCFACLDSEYLKEEDLILLELTPVCEDRCKRINKGIIVPNTLIELYKERQRVSRSKRLTENKRRKLAELVKDRENSETEFDGLKMLVDHDLDFNNVIFYNHTQTFCFGWRDKLEPTIAEAIKAKLKEINFPYQTEFKTY